MFIKDELIEIFESQSLLQSNQLEVKTVESDHRDERDITDFISLDFCPLSPLGESGLWRRGKRETERRQRSGDIENDISYLPDSISIRSVLRSLSVLFWGIPYMMFAKMGKEEGLWTITLCDCLPQIC